MSLLVSLDPGLRAMGLAVFRDGVLIHAELVRNPVKKTRGPEAWYGMAGVARSALLVRHLISEGSEFVLDGRRVLAVTPDVYVVEVPQVYRFGKIRVDPDDLIQIAGVGAAVGAVLKPATAVGYYPRQWKGQVPGDVFVERIRSRLSLAEKKACAPCPASLEHNLLDGVGLGLFHLGRL